MVKSKFEGTNEYVWEETLSNGLKIILVPNDNVKNFYLTLTTKYGSVNTSFMVDDKEINTPKGIAHFLEHSSFYMPNGNAFDYYSKIGSIINAFTSFDMTSYEVVANSSFKENLEYLLEYVYTPYFIKTNFEKEKGIILEEVKMYLDNPNMCIINGLFDNLLVNDEHKYLIGGTVNDVKSITLDDIKLCYESFYTPDNMFLIITGNFSSENALAIIHEKIKSLKLTSSNVKKKIIKEPFEINCSDSTKYMNVNKAKVAVGFKIPKSNFKSLKLSDNIIKLYIELILKNNFGQTSLLYEELKNGGVIDDDISYSITNIDEYYLIVFLVSGDYPDYCIEKIQSRFNNMELSLSDLNRLIKVYISEFVLMFDNIEFVNSYLIEECFENDSINYDIINIYRKMEKDVADEIIKNLKKNKCSTIKILPKKH